LDFFTGSVTTANAIFQQNAGDLGNRYLILVQLPEPIEGEFKTIAQITKERIRRSAKAILRDNEGKLKLDSGNVLDLGFRAYKLTTSNFKPWDGNASAIDSVAEQLNAFTENRL
jgi:adenine-specific DNA-methyltransferase